MGVYLHFVVARIVPDLAQDNCFVLNAPHDNGIHSSRIDILVEGAGKHAPDLAAPAWYKNAFSAAAPSSGRLTRDHFFEPCGVLADLRRMQGMVAAHPQDFPTMHWLRVGNQAGIDCLDRVMDSLDIYHEGQPSTIFGGWDKVELRPGYPRDSSQPSIDLTNAGSFICRICQSRSVNPIDLDGLEVLVSIDRQPFGMVIAPELDAACEVCRWAHRNACLVVPFRSEKQGLKRSCFEQTCLGNC
jgi:hypothetical protein